MPTRMSFAWLRSVGLLCGIRQGIVPLVCILAANELVNVLPTRVLVAAGDVWLVRNLLGSCVSVGVSQRLEPTKGSVTCVSGHECMLISRSHNEHRQSHGNNVPLLNPPQPEHCLRSAAFTGETRGRLQQDVGFGSGKTDNTAASQVAPIYRGTFGRSHKQP